MKRSELKVGDVLYFARPHEWNHLRDGAKATVVAVEPYKDTGYSWSRTRNYTQVASGMGVLVDIESLFNGEVRREIVSLGHLRGPYDQVLSEVKKRQAEKRNSIKQHEKKAEERRVTARAVCDRAQQHGYSVGMSFDRYEHILITPESLDKLLDAVAEDGGGGR